MDFRVRKRVTKPSSVTGSGGVRRSRFLVNKKRLEMILRNAIVECEEGGGELMCFCRRFCMYFS